MTSSPQVTKRLVDIRLVERPEDRNSFIAFLEFVYRVSIGSVSFFFLLQFVQAKELPAYDQSTLDFRGDQCERRLPHRPG